MSFRKVVMLTALAVLPAVAASAQADLAGTWKLNPARSKFTGDTLHFAAAGGGAITKTSGGSSYSFKPDGSPATTPFKETVKWTKTSEMKYTESTTINGMDLGTTTYEISADNKALAVVTKGKNPNGTPLDVSAHYIRIGMGKGLLGDWKSTEVKGVSGGYKIAANADGSITWEIPDIKGVLKVSANGADVAPVGPTVPSGLTIALTKKGPRTYGLVEKMSGKTVYEGVWSLSADGKTLTDTGGAPGVNEWETAVYEKQ